MMLHPTIAKLILNTPSFIIKPISRFISGLYLSKYANIKVIDKDKIESIKEPVIFVSNHLSNSDGLVLNRVLKRFKPYFVAGVKLSSNPISRIGLEAVKIIPIHPNTPDMDAIRKCIEKIREGQSILIFPEGTRSRTGKMIQGKKGVVLIAKKTGVPVIPIGITGTEKLMPINDNNMAKEKFNHADVTVRIGEAIYLPDKLEAGGKGNYNERCLDIIMTNIAKLLPEEYKGIYGSVKE